MKPASFDKNDYLFLGLFVGYVIFLQWSDAYLTGAVKTMAGSIGLVVFMGSPFIIEAYLTLLGGYHDSVNLWIRPDEKWVRMFFNDPVTYPMDAEGFENTYVTVFPLKEVVKDTNLGDIEQIALHHIHPYSKRFKFSSGRTYFKGMRINHGHTMNATAYRRDRSPLAISFTKPTLVMDLVEAGGDYELRGEIGPGMKLIETDDGLVLALDTVGEVTPDELLDLYMRQSFELSQLKSDLVETKRQRNIAKSLATQVMDRSDLLSSEFSGLMNVKPEIRQLVIQETLMWRSLFGDFDNAVKQLKGPMIPFKLTAKTITTMALALIVSVLVYLKWDSLTTGTVAAWEWFAASVQNQAITLVALLIICGTIIYGWRKAKQ